MSVRALGCSQHNIQWAVATLCLKQSGWGGKLITHLCLVLGAYLYSPHVPVWPAEG